MLGSLRFILATIVALSHIGWHPLGINPGISAVVIFYLISGYVVAGLWLRLRLQPNPLQAFYRDRLIRIYPTYLVVLMIGAVTWWVLSPESYFLSQTPGVYQWISNLTIVPLNYYMWNLSDQFAIIPPAWSLGAELQFYALLPLLLARPHLFFGLSLMVAVLAQVGWLPREWYTYRLLPGVLHIFLGGSLMALAAASERQRTALTLWCLYLGLAIVLWATGGFDYQRDFSFYQAGALNVSLELTVGLLLGIPLVFWLSPLRSPKWDQIAGHLSYGIFLNHFIVIWWIEESSKPLEIGQYLAGSIIMSALTWWLAERPAQAIRYRLRCAAD